MGIWHGWPNRNTRSLYSTTKSLTSEVRFNLITSNNNNICNLLEISLECYFYPCRDRKNCSTCIWQCDKGRCSICGQNNWWITGNFTNNARWRPKGSCHGKDDWNEETEGTIFIKTNLKCQYTDRIFFQHIIISVLLLWRDFRVSLNSVDILATVLFDLHLRLGNIIQKRIISLLKLILFWLP